MQRYATQGINFCPTPNTSIILCLLGLWGWGLWSFCTRSMTCKRGIFTHIIHQRFSWLQGLGWEDREAWRRDYVCVHFIYLFDAIAFVDGRGLYFDVYCKLWASDCVAESLSNPVLEWLDMNDKADWSFVVNITTPAFSEHACWLSPKISCLVSVVVSSNCESQRTILISSRQVIFGDGLFYTINI